MLCPRRRAGQRTSAIDYQAVIAFKRRILETPWSNFHAGACGDLRPAYGQFCNTRRHWLEDYALFRALKASQIRRQLHGPGQAGLPQSVEKCPYHFEVSRVEPFGEPVVDRLKERQRLRGTALIA